MAHGRPWYKRGGGDFVMGVLHFPDNDHRWTYSAIVDVLNDRDRPLADDPAFICGFARITKQKWKKVRSYLLDHGYLLLTDDGRITNPRFEREAAERAEQHERSVEGGREGGRRSAARRAGQTELPLDDENLQETYQQTSKKPTNLVGSFSEVSDPGSPENSDLVEPPPQPIRARVRGERLESYSHPTPNPEPHASNGAGSGRDLNSNESDDPELDALVGAVCEAAGFVPYPDQLPLAARTVAAWRDKGIDFEKTALPTIREIIARYPDRTRTLGRFTKEIVHQHTRRGGAKGPKKPRHLTAAQFRSYTEGTISLYRKMGRIAEAEALEQSLDRTASKESKT
jgi:uncharacterized protein YdaU (DUF1376 family)